MKYVTRSQVATIGPRRLALTGDLISVALHSVGLTLAVVAYSPNFAGFDMPYVLIKDGKSCELRIETI